MFAQLTYQAVSPSTPFGAWDFIITDRANPSSIKLLNRFDLWQTIVIMQQTSVDKSSTQKLQHKETSLLKLSLSLSFVSAIIGILFGLITESNAVILDGISSTISLVSTWFSVIASRLVVKPENERFQFGYFHLDPLVNFVRSLIVIVVSLYAIATAVLQLIRGGESITSVWVLVYALISLSIAAATYVHLMRYAIQNQSTSIRLEAQEWLINCLLSLGVLVGFGVAFWLEQIGLNSQAALIDPLLVFFIVAITLPFPVKTLYKNLLNILLVAPDTKTQQRIHTAIQQVGDRHGFKRFRLHTAQHGDSLDIEVNIIVDDSFEIAGVSYLDRIRQEIWDALNMPPHRLWLVVCFVGDERWA